jgi:c-di-GMP-binding flagellar brake protein YcgR
MGDAASVSIPLEVGQRVRMNSPFGQSSTIIRGWKPSQIILVDIPKTEYELETRVGIRCEIQFLQEGIFHRFETEILGVLGTASLPRFLGLRYPEHITRQNLRSSPRIRIRSPGSVLNLRGQIWKCELLDLSLGGCRIRITGTEFTPGEIIELSCVLPNQSSLVDVRCLVKRSYGAGSYGLEFVQIDAVNKEVLHEFLTIFANIESIEKRVESEEGMTGDLEEISLPDLLQLLVRCRKSYQLDISQESERGRIYVKDGMVQYATTVDRMGTDAIFELFSWPKGRYYIQRADWVPEQNIDAQLEFLLLEFARRLDQDAMD